MMSLVRSITAFLCLALTCVASYADEVISRGSNLSVDVAADGRLVMDLTGDLWSVPQRGGEASLLSGEPGSARRPRWSPDALRIAYALFDKHQQGIRIFDTVPEVVAALGRGETVLVVDDEGRENEGDLVCLDLRGTTTNSTDHRSQITLTPNIPLCLLTLAHNCRRH